MRSKNLELKCNYVFIKYAWIKKLVTEFEIRIFSIAKKCVVYFFSSLKDWINTFYGGQKNIND